MTVLSWSLLLFSLLFLVAIAMEVPSSGRVTDVLSVRVERSVAASVILPVEVCTAEDSVGAGNGSLRTTSTPIVVMRSGFIVQCYSFIQKSFSGICRSGNLGSLERIRPRRAAQQ